MENNVAIVAQNILNERAQLEKELDECRRLHFKFKNAKELRRSEMTLSIARMSSEETEKEFGIKNLSNEDILQNSDKVLEWIRSTGAKRILVHFNLCILDPTEIIASACNVKQGLKMQVISRIINDVSEENNVIGLTIAESFPRTALRLQKMFSGIRIFKDA